MKFKDIVNRDLVNLTNCEYEPIHIPGSIQPHGCLLGIRIADMAIEFCSGNSVEFVGLRYEQLLGKSFDHVFGINQARRLEEYIGSIDYSSAAPLEIELMAKRFSCTILISADLYLLEFELKLEDHFEITDIYRQTKRITNYIQKANTLQELCSSVANEIRLITGYDRVMIYKFDEDYNGEVFAESKVEHIEPFAGLHYPHTDIPAQARALYMKNLLRIIVDVNYIPVPIYTIDDALNKNIDLSLSTLRSVSPIHVEYLQNMGVAATLTISLMHQGRLWGLIACHHYSAKYITSDIRITALLQAHFLTSQISVRQLGEEYEIAKKVNKALDELLARVFSADSISLEKMIMRKELLSLTNAASVVIVIDDQLFSSGDVPPEAETRKLVNWLHTYNSSTVFNTSNLSLIYPDAKKWCASAAGILFHSLGSGVNNCIIWLRPEALQEVYWGGNPEMAIVKNEKGLSPRKSFGLWKEVKKCESARWQKPELAAAANFVNALQKHVHMMFLTKEELKQRKLSETLKEANSELENLNWISSHDLREPLRKIQLFASRIIDEDYTGNYQLILDSVKKMNNSAKRMQLLITDILAYSRFSHIEGELKTVDFGEVTREVIAELDGEIKEKNAIVRHGAMPSIKGMPVLLQQLLVNLIRNSLKFSKADISPEIIIAYAGAEDFLPAEPYSFNEFYKVTVRDNGIGFEDRFNESIFKVFTRLHNNSQYSGSGVGLALCRKIMKTHNGYITAKSSPGMGAVISLYFPI